jgi:hypothetical protein
MRQTPGRQYACAAGSWREKGEKEVRCWFAPHDVQEVRKLHEQIDEAIRVHDKLLLIRSS